MQLSDLVQHAKDDGGWREMGSVACFCAGCREPVTSYYVFRNNWPFVAFFCATHQRVFGKMLTYDLTEAQATERGKALSVSI